MIVVAETTHYASRAAALMSGEDCAAVIEEIARDPQAGDIIPGTGGVRKIRVALPGRGKSGGARVIFYYQNDDWPVLLLEVFAKNEKANLSKAQCNTLAKAIAELKAARKTNK
jgi:hypothetical protein